MLNAPQADEFDAALSALAVIDHHLDGADVLADETVQLFRHDAGPLIRQLVIAAGAAFTHLNPSNPKHGTAMLRKAALDLAAELGDPDHEEN